MVFFVQSAKGKNKIKMSVMAGSNKAFIV